MIKSFIVDYKIALEPKRLKQRKGYVKISNTIAFGGLSVDALALYLSLAKLSEKTKISELYLREFIKIKDDKKISLKRLREAKRELISFKLLTIQKVREGSLNFYEWILKDENGATKRHFNKTETSLKNESVTQSENLKNHASSIDTKTPTENQKSLYIETRAHAHAKEFINLNINYKNNKNKNLKNLKNLETKEKKNADAFNHFLQGELMAKEKFKVPEVKDLMEQIKAFNAKNGTSFDEALAKDFIGYWDAREWKRGSKKMASISGSLYTWLKYAKENEERRTKRFKKKEADESVVEGLMEYYGLKDENKSALLGCF